MNLLLHPIRRAYDFKGRSTRLQFWTFVFMYTSIIGLLEFIELFTYGMPVLSTILQLLLLVPSTSIMVRRLHDMGRSGWWSLLAFTVIGLIVPLIFCLADSDPGRNQYGPNPKNRSKGKPSPNKTNDVINLPSTNEIGKPEKLIKFCGNCGEKITPESKFCNSCGCQIKQ